MNLPSCCRGGLGRTIFGFEALSNLGFAAVGRDGGAVGGNDQYLRMQVCINIQNGLKRVQTFCNTRH